MIMNFEDHVTLIARSPAIKLLRAKNAPLILSFLYREFKETHRLTASHYELVNRLADYLEATHFTEERDEYEVVLQRAKRYVDEWCNEENRYLRKFSDENGEPVHELSTDTEKTFQWIASLERKEFVGTESRFLDIFAKLRELIEQSMVDPRQRIEELERKKEEIEAQIREVQETGNVDVFSDTQIKERFVDIGKIGRELMADFKEVEDNFKDITRRIYEKQARHHMTKGAILGYTLDATAELSESDQGRSFHAFWRFLMVDNKQDELNRLTGRVFTLLEDRGIESDDPFLRRIKVYLHEAGQKIMVSNHRLAEKLSRILAERYLLDRRRAMELIGEVKNLAVETLENPPRERSFIDMGGDADVRMVMDRPLGEPAQTAAFAHQPDRLGDADISLTDLEKLFDPFDIDREALKENIDRLVREKGQITLADVVQQYPVKRGIAELVTYLTIATASPHHIIDAQSTVCIEWRDDGIPRQIKMPQVIYGKDLVR
jgi:hypothetical protein